MRLPPSNTSPLNMASIALRIPSTRCSLSAIADWRPEAPRAPASALESTCRRKTALPRCRDQLPTTPVLEPSN